MKNLFAQRLKELRVSNGLTQKQVSKKLNISASTYSNYERELCEPPLSLIVDFAKFYDVSVNYLLGLSDY